jgi:photosystem II stability/assembly factor-like uncharacterized protein
LFETIMMQKNINYFICYLCVLCLSSCKPSGVTPPLSSQEVTIVTPQHLFTVCTPDPKHIWAGGYKSIIIHSSDGGKNWKNQNSGISSDICSINFVDNKNGWAVGKDGAILHTTDGGETWVMQQGPAKNHLFSVYFVDKNNGWAVGYLATVLHTHDGGLHWTDQHQQTRKPLDAQLKKDKNILVLKPQDPTFNSVYAVNIDNVWIVGEYGTILYSSDGGTTWLAQECRDLYPVVSEKEWITPVPSLYSVYFKDKNNGWAVGMDGIVIQTRNGGRSWDKLDSPLAQEKPTLYKVKVLGKRGWAVGQFGEYMISCDGGESWQKKTGYLRTRHWLRDMDFADENCGFAVGESGTIVCTENGGEGWNMLSGMPLRPSDF